MVRKINYGKIAAVMLITVLIWIFADRALEEELPDKPATIVVDESANPKLWVSFNQASSADVRVTLSGPHAAVVDISRELKKGEKLEFDFDAAREKMDEPGEHTLTLLSFLQKDKKIKRLGLKIKSCDPNTLGVHVVKLVKKQLTVKCVDENQNLVKTETIQPKQVDMPVPEDWDGETLVATVLLMPREISQARVSAVKKAPYIELAPGQIRQVPTIVKVTMPQQEDSLSDHTITAVTLGVSLSANLQGKYIVEVTNLNEVIGAIAIRATQEAKSAYEGMRYHVILEIDDDDAKSTEPRRELVYNFPSEYVRNDEIELKQQPVIAKFKLTPLLSAETP